MTNTSGSEFPKGVAAAALTPMKADFSVDHERLVAHCRWLLDEGCNGIALMGTTGEANSLDAAERMALLEAVVEAGIAKHRLMVGTGCCSFPETVALTRHALELGVHNVLMLPPFYYKKVSDDGLFASFAHVIEQVGDDNLRLYLYHFPNMSSIPLSFGLIERLLERYPGVVAGIKDSSRDWQHSAAMIERFPGFRVYPGTEQFLLNALRAGGPGCISATTNVTGSLAARVYASRNAAGVDALQGHLTEMRLALQEYPAVPALKALIASYYGDEAWTHVRPPHLPLDSATRVSLEHRIDTLIAATPA